jgi:hypothetical protein
MTYMFGDNQAVVNNSAIPHSCLGKRHNALSNHRVREEIAAKVVNFVWINGKNNPADIVSKHWSYPQIWHRLQAILFYSGDTSDLIKEDEAMNNNGDENMEEERKIVQIKNELIQKRKCLPGVDAETSIN